MTVLPSDLTAIAALGLLALWLEVSAATLLAGLAARSAPLR